ncbi:hypothetical protein ACJMK2_021773 [Sinanodonta woodiana]|uniref:Uncharacterized protein n=1 Tax=Sinanodonta woodiana TaxID=1069815 RepID=A0ABD3TI16_SINWO
MARCDIVIACLFSTVFLLVDITSGGQSNELTVEEDGMKASLKFIINHPLNKNRPASFLLGSPLTYEEAFFTLQPALDKIDRLHVEQIIQLYEYTDGINSSLAGDFPPNDLWLIPGYYLMSLKEAVDTALTMRRVSAVWNSSWLPVFSSGAGDFIVFDLNNGRIFEIVAKESLVWEVAANIEEFVRQSAHNLQSGMIFIGEDGLMDETIADDRVLNKEDPIVQKTGERFSLQIGHIFHRIYIARSVETRPVSETNIDKDVAQPRLVFNCGNMPNVCANIRNAINNNRKTRNLQRITSRSQIRRNRRASCGRLRCPRGQSCDEYPFASTSQGGRGATIRCVPAAENNSQGGQLNGFYRRYRLGNNSWFRQTYP